MKAKYGLVVTNIGTPNTPTAKDVGTYLSEFLMDPQVLRIPALFRFLLVRGIIVPFRASKSAEKYKKVWTEQGSPLMQHSKDFVGALQESLGSEWIVELGMRYGTPNFEQACDQLNKHNLEKVFLLPLFPQYALSSSQSSIDHFKKIFFQKQKSLEPKVIDAFFNHPGYTQSWVDVFKKHRPQNFDHVIFSYHGLPQSHLSVLDPVCSKCPQDKECPAHHDTIKTCYRKQCFATTKNLIQALGLSNSECTVGFQSRLGPAWIGPNTETVIDDLAAKGKKNIVVCCPSFVSDCLETLEEVQIGLRERFIERGGESLTMIPCLNAHPTWIQTAKEIVCAQI
jgi:protoporphyrin/coproporphyrin ferrochelatase